MSKRLSRFLSRLSSRKKKSSQPEFISIVGRAHTAAAKSRQPGLKEQQRRISVVNDKGRDYVFGVGDEFSEEAMKLVQDHLEEPDQILLPSTIVLNRRNIVMIMVRRNRRQMLMLRHSSKHRYDDDRGQRKQRKQRKQTKRR